MDLSNNNFEQGDKYTKRLLDRSQYSDCYSQTFRRRLSVLEALNKKPLSSSSNRHYDGNPFEKEFSQVNKAATITASSIMEDDQLEMTYVSTWPEDNTDLSFRTYDVEPRDSLFCVKSLGDAEAAAAAAATNRQRAASTEYQACSSKQFRRDIVDSDVESISAHANLRSTSRTDPKLSFGEHFGPSTMTEFPMQSTLNTQYEREFEQGNAQMQLHGIDEFFGTRVIEICEPTIIKFHRKSCGSEAVGTQTHEAELTYVKEDDGKNKKETTLDTENSTLSCNSEAAATQTRNVELTYVKHNNDKDRKNQDLDSDDGSAHGSELFRELDREMDKLELDDLSDKTVSPPKMASSSSKDVNAKRPVDVVDAKNGFYVRNNVTSSGNHNSISPKNATFLVDHANASQQRERSFSKTTSFLKRHTSFLFKNFRTPKLVRRKSSVESTRTGLNHATGSQWPQASASALARSNTMGSSDNEKPTTRFQQQVQQVRADLPPDMDDTMASEMESFLKVALGNGQYNSTMAHANLDSTDQNYTIMSLDTTDGAYFERNNDRKVREPKSEPLKRSGTLNRTLSMYKTLTQKIRDKFRIYDHSDTKTDMLSTFFQQNTVPEDLNPELREIVKKLQEKANVQDTLIYQTSKALQLCDSMREFTVSPERVEYERLLLLASLTKKAILKEIDQLTSQRIYNNNEAYAYTERGEVTLKDIRLQLREDVLRRERQNGDIVEWFVVVVIQGVTVWATRAIACPISSPQIYFPGQHVISGLTPDFSLSIKVYSMKLQQLQMFNHDDKYHITRGYTLGSGNKIKTPKMLRKKNTSPKQYKVKFNGIKETSFVFCGGVDLMLYDLKLLSPWPLSSLSSNSILHGTIDLNLSCKLELSIFHAGFLTHCEETGDLAWSRRWCLLEGHTLLFWNYPREQEYNPPIYVIDLVDCVSSSVDLIDRKQCPRPRTLLLETRSRASDRDHFIVDGRSTGQIHRHLLSFDNHEELTEWHSKLNHVVAALSDWNIIHTARSS